MPAASCLCVRHLFDARRLIRERWLGGAMLSLSLGRDGWVKAAAPAPRIECALLRCATFVAVQLFLLAILEVALLETLGAHRYAAMQRCNKVV